MTEALELKWTEEDRLCLDRRYYILKPVRALWLAQNIEDWSTFSVIFCKAPSVLSRYISLTPERSWRFSGPKKKGRDA